MGSQSLFHSGICLEAMKIAPGLMEPKDGFGQTPTVALSSTSFANIVRLSSFNA